VPLAGAGSFNVSVAVGELGPTIEPGEIWNVLTLGRGSTVRLEVTVTPFAVAVNLTTVGVVTTNVWTVKVAVD
jgi:hypothetical protein